MHRMGFSIEVVKMYPQNSKISTTDNAGNPRGIPTTAIAGAFGCSAATDAHVLLRWLLRSLVLTTSTVAQKGKTGRITALHSSSYSYWIRN